jgi:hypothetical protein
MVNIFDEGNWANAPVERVATAAVRTAHVVNLISLNVLFFEIEGMLVLYCDFAASAASKVTTMVHG